MARAWLPLAAASAAVAIAAGGALLHFAPRLRPPEKEPAWQWNDEAQIDICLSARGALSSNLRGGANLRIEGILVGFGPMSPDVQPGDAGNIVDCIEYPEGRHYIDVQDGDGETWRIMYALSGLPYPTLRARVGSHVHFRFDAAFHHGKTASFLLLDGEGPVLGGEQGAYALHTVEGTQLSVSWGRPFGHRSSEGCGEEVARALRISGDTEASVPPGQVGSVLLHGTHYRFWNVQSIAVGGHRCVDQDDWTSWLLWRE